jgi:hypothetical protein
LFNEQLSDLEKNTQFCAFATRLQHTKFENLSKSTSKRSSYSWPGVVFVSFPPSRTVKQSTTPVMEQRTGKCFWWVAVPIANTKMFLLTAARKGDKPTHTQTKNK